MEVHAGPGIGLGKIALMAAGAVGAAAAVTWRIIRSATPISWRSPPTLSWAAMRGIRMRYPGTMRSAWVLLT